MRKQRVSKESAKLGVSIRASRCEHCASLIPLWTPERMVKAAKTWTEKHGRAPGWLDWEKSGYDHPSAHTVVGFFLTFHNFLYAAGLTKTHRRWTSEQSIQALFEDTYERGRLPRSNEWRVADPARPSYYTVLKLFGSWNAFIVAGGYTPAKAWSSKDQTAAVA